MSEERKGSLLLPLGIGAGLLLLLTAMKKKDATPALPAAKADDSAALPEINPGEAAAPQIAPKPAPSYAQAVVQTAAQQTQEEEEVDEPGTDDEEPTNDDPPSPDQSLQPDEPDNDEPNEDEPEEEESNNGPAYTKSHSPGPAKASMLVDAAKMLIRPGAAKPMRRKTTKKPIRPVVPATRVPVPPAVVAAQPEIRIASRPAAALPAAAAVTRPGAIFPLKPGVSGNVYVKEIQKRLGVPVTGNFGVQTKAALVKRYRVQEISEALYKQIVTGKNPAAPVKRVPVRKGPVRPAVNRPVRPVVRKGKAVRKRK